MLISMNELIGSVNQLATLQPGGVNQEATARFLSFLIQFTSEAARFCDVAGVFTDVMTRPDSNYHGLPALQQNIENSWDQITRYAYAVTQNPATPSVNITGVQRFKNFGDVQRKGDDSHGPTEFRQQHGRLVPHRAVTPIAG